MNIAGEQLRGIMIRPASIEDYGAILDVWKKSGSNIRPAGRERREAFQRQIGEFAELYLVAMDGDRVIGVVLGSHDQRKGWINRLAVLPEYRRRGVAKALISACDVAIRAQGIEIVCALVEPHNEASARLFESLGYENYPVLYFKKLSHPDV